MSKPGTSILTQSKLQYRCIPISKISWYRQRLLRYLYTIEALCCDIEFRVLWYRCFFAWVAVAPARYWTRTAVYTVYCVSSVRWHPRLLVVAELSAAHFVSSVLATFIRRSRGRRTWRSLSGTRSCRIIIQRQAVPLSWLSSSVNAFNLHHCTQLRVSRTDDGWAWWLELRVPSAKSSRQVVVEVLDHDPLL
jgi:hypothetical protein